MITLNTGEQLDPKILKVMRAIRQVESGGDYNAVGDAGTSTGAFQFQGATWNTWAKKVLGDANAPKTKANQNKVAYYKIKELKDQGRTPREIALIWNGGEPVEKKGFNKRIGLAYDSGAYADKVMGILGSMPRAEMPQEPVIREVPEVAPAVPQTTFGTGNISGNIPVVKQLSDVGVGIGSTIGKTLLGAVQAPLRITGALGRAVGADTQYVDKAIGGLENVKQGMYQRPFEQQLATGLGKTGQVIGTLAPFIATAGAVNPATAGLRTIPRVLARAGADVAVSQAQTGGDLATAGATGVSSAVGDALLGGKAKAVIGVLPSLKQIGKTTATGYVSDVSSGMAGMRGENRTGAKAFIPGAGTLIGGTLGTAQTSISTLKDPVRKVTNIISKREKELQKLEDNYAIIRKVTAKTKAQGIDPKKILAQTDLLSGAVDNTGTLRTQNASIELNDFIKPQEKVISDNLRREGVLLNLKDVKAKLLNIIDSTGIKGGAKLRAIKNVEDDIAGLMLEADSTGKIPLSTIHDAKIDKYANINFLNPESKRVDKAIAKGLKELVESNTRSVDVKNLNRELQQHYSVLDLLEKLDGKKVEGGKLGKYFAQTVGGIVGSHFGPLGAIAGAEIGAGIKGAQMSSKFTGKTGIKLEQSEQMKEALTRSRQPRLGLPAPREGSPRSTINSQNAIPLRNATRLPDEVQAPSANQSYSNKLGNRNTNQSTTIIPTRIGISKSITIPKGSSIDQTRAVVNNYLDNTLKNIADPDTFDVISANPQAFYREQIDNIVQGLKQGGTKYARLANSISSIDASKINNFETLASKIREKLNAKTFMETVTGKGIPNRQGGFIKNPLSQSDIPNKDIIIPKEDIKIFRGEGKGIGNTTLVKGRYFAESPEFASAFGNVSEFTIPKGAKIFNLDSVKKGDSYIPQDMLVQPEKLTKYLLDKGFEFTKNTNTRGVEYVRLGDNIDQLTNIIKRNNFKTKSEFLEYLADKGYNDGKGVIGKQLGDTDVAWNRYTGKDYVKAPSKADVRVYTKSDPLIQEAKKYKSAEEFKYEIFDDALAKLRGVKRDSTITIPTSKVKIKWKQDLENAKTTAKQNYDPNDAPAVDFTYDIKSDKFILEDGHNRYTSALRNKQPLKGTVNRIEGSSDLLSKLYKDETGMSIEDIWKQANKSALPKSKK